MREFRDMERAVRSWLQYLEQGRHHFGSAKAITIAPDGRQRVNVTSTPSDFRAMILQLGYMLHEVGPVRGEILFKRATRRAKSAEASFDQIAAEHCRDGITRESCRREYRDGVVLFYGAILRAELPDYPNGEREEVVFCAAQVVGEPCALQQTA